MLMKKHYVRIASFIAVCVLASSCAKYESYKSEEAIKEEKKRDSVMKELLPKAQEYANLSFPAEQQAAPVLKLKIALVTNVDGETTDLEIKGYGKSNGNPDPKARLLGLNPGQLAASPDEVKTVVRVKCEKGKPVGKYEDSRFTGFPFTYYSSVCELAVMDLEAKKTTFGKKYENSKQAKDFSDLVKFGNDYLTPPAQEMQDFLKNAKKSELNQTRRRFFKI